MHMLTHATRGIPRAHAPHPTGTDKRTGLLLRAPYLANVLQQPFYSTSVMTRLVKARPPLPISALKPLQWILFKIHSNRN